MNDICSYFQKFDKKNFLKRLHLLIISSIMMPLGIALYYQCGLGTDPYSVLVDGHHSLSGLSYGQISNIYNACWLVFLLICGRKKIGIGTIINYFVSGTFIDLFTASLQAVMPEKSIAVKIVLLVLAVVIYAVGVGMLITADLGIGGYEYLSLLLSDKLHIDLKWVRVALDLIMMIIGIILGLIAGRPLISVASGNGSFYGTDGLIGIGTIAGVMLTGPIMKWFMSSAGSRLDRWFNNN